MSRTVPILAYHKVDERAPTKFWVSSASFDLQMKALRDQRYETVRLEDLWLCAQGSRELPLKPLCITFDDGYENFYGSAFPILQQYGYIATVFLPTAFIGDDCRHFNTWDRSPEERAFRVPHLLWDEVLQLQRYGIEFGAHTRTHPDLGILSRTDLQQATEEIVGSRNEIEQRLSAAVKYFSCPYKSSNSAIERILREAGFHGSVTMSERLFDISNGNWFQMDRIPVFSAGRPQSADEAYEAILSLIQAAKLQTDE
jgi:peptidoglycan/xylan/chitin deacetylase (PgdA/CDA1 family)